LRALTGSKRPYPDPYSYCATEEPKLTAVDSGERVLQGRLSRPERLDLGAPERDPALVDFENVVVVPSAPITRHAPNHRLVRFGQRPRPARDGLSPGGLSRGHLRNATVRP
jgi:hypothetical protein